MTAFLNLSALVLGLTAWVLGFRHIGSKHFRPRLSFFSFAAMGCAMVAEFLELRHRIALGDLSAIMDIYPAMAGITAVLLLGTLILNAIPLFRSKPE